jgi:hypothetical protein
VINLWKKGVPAFSFQSLVLTVLMRSSAIAEESMFKSFKPKRSSNQGINQDAENSKAKNK